MHANADETEGDLAAGSIGAEDPGRKHERGHPAGDYAGKALVEEAAAGEGRDSHGATLVFAEARVEALPTTNWGSDALGVGTMQGLARGDESRCRSQ